MRCDEPGPDIFAFDVFKLKITEREEIDIKAASLTQFEMLLRKSSPKWENL